MYLPHHAFLCGKTFALKEKGKETKKIQTSHRDAATEMHIQRVSVAINNFPYAASRRITGLRKGRKTKKKKKKQIQNNDYKEEWWNAEYRKIQIQIQN